MVREAIPSTVQVLHKLLSSLHAYHTCMHLTLNDILIIACTVRVRLPHVAGGLSVSHDIDSLGGGEDVGHRITMLWLCWPR